MQMSDVLVNRWLERGGKFFRSVGRNPVVRANLFARGLDDDELARGWALYSEILGFGPSAKTTAAQDTTAAAEALNEIDAWDAPAYSATRAVLAARFPSVSAYLLQNLEAAKGTAAAAGVERFLTRIDVLRDGKADGVTAKDARGALALLATRKILDEEREERLRTLLETVRKGAQPDEAITHEVDPRREELLRQYVAWLHEWREVARTTIARRDYLIALGLAHSKRATDTAPSDDDEPDAEPNAVAKTPAA